MSPSISDTQKKRGRGRPSTGGQMPGTMVRMPAVQLAALDAWIAGQPEPKPTRPEAIRRLVEKGLAGEAATAVTRLSDAALDSHIAQQEDAIAEMPEPAERSPEAALAAMDKAIAENDLINMKNKRARRKITKSK